MSSTVRVRLQQSGALLLGAVLAAAMVALGLWQLGVYEASGTRAAAERAGAPPVPISRVAPPGAAVTDGFGRTVLAEGSYDPTLQVLVPLDAASAAAGGSRVVTALRLSGGGVLAVVRGVTAASVAPAPPPGPVTVSGILLPSEDSGDPPTSVRLPTLAQTWPGPLVGGVITLDADAAEAQGLQAAAVDLPPAPGRLRNGAYAMQWWLFAAFALLFAGRVARDLGRAAEEDLATAAAPGASDRPPAAGVRDPEHQASQDRRSRDIQPDPGSIEDRSSSEGGHVLATATRTSAAVDEQSRGGSST